jgi:hypothetical protein
MAKSKMIVVGKKVTRGERMKIGKGWKLVGPKGLSFKATLIRRMKIGAENVTVFRVRRYILPFLCNCIG